MHACFVYVYMLMVITRDALVCFFKYVAITVYICVFQGYVSRLCGALLATSAEPPNPKSGYEVETGTISQGFVHAVDLVHLLMFYPSCLHTER